MTKNFYFDRCLQKELQNANFVRVLAFNSNDQALLKKICAASNLPIVTKISQHLNEHELFDENILPYKKNLALDVLATDLRGILFYTPRPPRMDYKFGGRFHV